VGRIHPAIGNRIKKGKEIKKSSSPREATPNSEVIIIEP
jgi:hypothetical protein